jgi:Amt family ammonium transporter
LDGNFIQVPIQLAAIVTVSVWSFVVTYIILVVINKIPFLRLRLNDEAEMMGVDWSEMGERAYAYLPMTESGEFIAPNGNSTSADVAQGVVVKRVPDIIEQPAESGGDLGGIKLQDMDLANTPSFFQLDGKRNNDRSPSGSVRTDSTRKGSSGINDGASSSTYSSKKQQKARAID